MINISKDNYLARAKKNQTMFFESVSLVKEKFGSYLSESAWSALKKYAETFIEQTKCNIANPPQSLTICHGDYHPQQCFFPTKSNPRFAIVDWQILGIREGAQELARAMSFIDPILRRDIEESLVRNYLQILLKNSSENYTFEQLWEDLSLQVLDSLMTNIAAIANTDLHVFIDNAAKHGSDALEVLLSRPGSAVDDWKAGEELDSRLGRVSSV